MTVLLDTHVFLWFILGEKRCSRATRKSIEDPKNECVVSIASIWEIAIKHALGKLALHQPIEAFFQTFVAGGFDPMPIHASHVLTLAQLPLHHRDPFDRMLIAQAKAEGMQLLTSDPQFALYDVPLLKA